MISAGGGQSQGQSSGSSNFGSTPWNFADVPFQGLATPVGNAIWNTLSNGAPSQGFQMNGGPSGTVSPTQVWNPATGQQESTAGPNNPLVAPMTQGESDKVGWARFLSDPTKAAPAMTAYNAVPATAGAAYNNPLASGAVSADNRNTAAYASQPANFGYNQVGATQGFVNSADYGGTQLGKAGQTADVIASNAQPWFQRGGTMAAGSDYGQGAAGEARGTAGQVVNSAKGGGLTTATNLAEGGNWGRTSADQASAQAATGTFGQGMSGQGAQFASQGENLGDVTARLRQEMDPNFAASLATSPETARVIQGAENPILNAFNTQTVPGLAGTFAAAGQRIADKAGGGVGGSSAYDVAGANALTGLGANLGAVSSSIENNVYGKGIDINAAAPGQLAGVQNQKFQAMEQAATTQAATQTAKEQALIGATGAQVQSTGAQAGAATAAGTAQGNAAYQQAQAQTGAAGAQTAAQGTQTGQVLQTGQNVANTTAQQATAQTGVGTAETGAAGTQAGAMTQAGNMQIAQGQATTNAQNQTAATAAGLATSNTQNAATVGAVGNAVTQQELDATMKALQAEALPRIIQQYGIDQGLQLYQQQVTQLLTAMGLGAQAAMPVLGVSSWGTGSSQGTNSSANASFGISF